MIMLVSVGLILSNVCAAKRSSPLMSMG